MLNNLTNFANIIKNKLVKKEVLPTDLIALGRADQNYNGGYQPIAITAEDLVKNLAVNSDRLIAGNKEVVLTDTFGNATLTFSSGDAVIETLSPGSDLRIRTLNGDDIILESGDDIRLQGDQGLYDDESEGGDINLYAGDGSDGDTANAGYGGDIRIEAGNAGNSLSGSQGEGGVVTIEGGYTTASTLPGGSINLYPGNSVDGISGDVIISGNVTWTFDTNKANLRFPAVILAALPSAAAAPGARAMITDSTAFASGNFGVIAVGSGSNIVPVFSDGTNWVLG
jgi:hypothetical protein